MTWDPELHDVLARRRLEEAAALLGEPLELPSDEATSSPEPTADHHEFDPLAPIDPNAPVSGHRPAEGGHSIADSPEQDWSLASSLIFPNLRPTGTHGLAVEGLSTAALAAEGQKMHSQPLVAAGPCDIPIVYALSAGGFDVLVNADHLLTWGVDPEEVDRAAVSNLAAWSAGAGWTAEESGGRRLLSSDTGDGGDAARILLPDVREHLASELGGDGGRVLVGLPERHLLVAGCLRPGDEEFGGLFASFVVDQADGADEPIDRRVFELVGGELVEFAG